MLFPNETSQDASFALAARCHHQRTSEVFGTDDKPLTGGTTGQDQGVDWIIKGIPELWHRKKEVMSD